MRGSIEIKVGPLKISHSYLKELVLKTAGNVIPNVTLCRIF